MPLSQGGDPASRDYVDEGIRAQQKWTLDTLKEYFQRQVDDLRVMLSERYEAQTRAVDAAFLSQRTAIDAALLSAEKAVTKAESAAERRFESVNEFRKTLSDQTTSFPTRNEIHAEMQGLSGSISRLTERVTAIEVGVSSLPTLAEAAKSNALRITKIEDSISEQRGRQAAYAFVISALLVVFGAIAIIVPLISRH